MAYGKKYIIRFANRIQNDIYRTEIWEKDFVGDTVELTGAEDPFTAGWTSGDTDILTPIKPVELTLSFITDGSILIEDFYSDDDERFRVDHYFESAGGGGGSEKLLHSGYLIQDGISEPVTDRKHIITLKATDNLALLKNIKWNEIDSTIDYSAKLLLLYFAQWAIKGTGLYSPDSAIDLSLPLRTYNNLFENSTPNGDRSDDPLNDTFTGTVLEGKLFQNTDNTWDDLYSVLTKILGDLNCDLVQADGYWNIRRIPEYQLFTGGAIPGTEWIYPSTVNSVTLSPLVNIARTGGDSYPINEDQTKGIQRPLRLVKNTFNYNQPASYINQSDLQLPDGATPYATNTVGDLRYDDYSLATYFPYWVQRDGDASYLEVVTDTSIDPESEVERYIVTPSADDVARGVQFNPIPVTKDDIIDFNIQYRTFTDTNDMLNFGVRFVIIGTASTSYNLIDFPPILTAPSPGLMWDDIANDDWDTWNGVHAFISDAEADDIDTTQYQYYSLSGFLGPNKVLPLVPADGMLLIQVMGTNTYSASENTTTLWKDIRLSILNYVNQSTQIIAQTHTDTGNSLIKAIEETDLNIDDSPRNTIAGTLFTNELTNFEYTDINTGEATGIGDVDFTRTKLWHRAEISEGLRLGNIITQERLGLQFTSRLMFEGTFRNIRYDTDKFISPLCLFTIDWLTGRFFTAASLKIDYMDCSYNTRLVEIYNDDDIITTSVFLTGVKAEEDTISTGVIHFDSTTNFGGVENYITVSDSNSKFTYINVFDTTITLSEIFFVPISGVGTATFTITKNGGVIATDTVDASEHFKRIDFLLTEPVTAGDYFEAFVDNGGADVDIQSGSINITINDVQSMVSFPYQFKYLYKTD